MATSFSGGRSRSTRREPPTMGKQLVNFITCVCGSSAPFFVIYKAGREPMPYWSVLTLEGNSGEKVALWLLTSLCTSVKREVEVAL